MYWWKSISCNSTQHNTTQHDMTQHDKLCHSHSNLFNPLTSLITSHHTVSYHIVEVKTKRQIRQIFFTEIFSLESNFLSPEIFSPQWDLFGCVGTFPTQKIARTAKMVPMGGEKSPEREKIHPEKSFDLDNITWYLITSFLISSHTFISPPLPSHQDSKTASKMEAKLNITTQGYTIRANKLQSAVLAAFDTLSDLQRDYGTHVLMTH